MLCDNKMNSVLVLLVLVTKVYSDECPGPGCEGFNLNSNDAQVPYIQEITTHTAKPVGQPEILSMLAEDQLVLGLPAMTTIVPSITTMSANATGETRGRALDFAVGDHENVLSNSTGVKDLSDVSMDDDDDDVPLESAKILAPKLLDKNVTLGICEKGGLTYENGEKLEVGCDSVCTCTNGKMDCLDRCKTPFVRKGKKAIDPFCIEKSVEDPCCAILQCTSDTETEPLEICTYKNKTYNRGDVIQEGCLEVCSCEAGGKLVCKARCAPISKPIDNKCLEIPDMNDPCCKTLICDVTLKDNKLISAKYVNGTTIKLDFDSKIETNQTLPLMDISNDKMNWKTFTPLPGGYLSGLETLYKFAKIENTDDIIEIQNVDDGNSKKIKDKSKHGKGCEHKGRDYKIGDEFNDGCDFFCACKESGVKCLKMECPTYFGTDVLDPNCLEWETVPANFTPVAPVCCPEKLRCKNNGSCVYKGETYQNWQQVPSNVTGCEKRCYCEMGKIDCQNICPPVTALPSENLECPPHHAILNHLPGDDCCVYWMCNPDKENLNGLGMFPGNFNNLPGFQQPHDDIQVNILEALDANTIRLAFTVPPVIVGLHGRVEVRYTHRDDDDLSSWELQIFAPPSDLIATSQLEFDLVDLRPDTEYRIKITVMLRDLHNTPTSRIYKIRTLKAPLSSTLPPMIPIDPDMVITDINSTWVNVAWRKFTEYELQFIDGVQLRFKEIDGKIYAATPLIHRAVTSYTLENLKPNSKYEIGIFFIPFPGQLTELHAEHMLHFTTANEVDTYGFNVTLEISLIKPTNVEISWSGVPYPEDKYVNIYRAIYQSDSGKSDLSTFKVAKRDSPSKSIITDLKPGTRYRLWLEIYLTNGKIKTSNVQDFITKPRSVPSLGASSKQDKLSGEPEDRGDYYGPLVIVAILAAIAILSTLVLLLILVRRHSQNKACITPPQRVSQSAYDNPTYKVEIQQETMDL